MIPHPSRESILGTYLTQRWATSNKAVCSAGHLLLDTRSYATDLAFHTSKATASRPRQRIKRATQPVAGYSR